MSNESAASLDVSIPHGERTLWCWKLSELFLLGGVVLLGLLILFIHLLTWGRSVWEDARRSAETTCVVQKLYRHSRSDNQGVLYYRPEIQVEYSVGTKSYTRRIYDRTTLTEDQGFVYSLPMVEEILLRYKIGESYRCWYSVDRPEMAILQKNRSFWGWWFLLIPITQIAFGVGGLIWRGVGRSQSREKRSLAQRRKNLFPTVPETQRINESPGTELAYRLPLAIIPTLQTAVGLSLAILWNMIAWYVFFYILSLRRDWADFWLAILFGALFCGAGLIVLPWFIRRIRSAFGAGTTILEISDHPVYPGRKYRLALMQSGRLDALRYDLFVVSGETARYRQGTDTLTHQKEVFRLPLLSKSDFSVARGETVREEFFLKLPIGAMHSFQAENSQIFWKIVIEIDVRGGGQLRRECPLVVLPFSPPELFEDAKA